MKEKEELMIKKFSGEFVAYEREKLLRSLINAKAGERLAAEIADDVESKMYDGMPTHKIYRMAFNNLKRIRRSSAARYKIKKAIMELGPSGYPFEKYVGHIFEHDGYEVEVGVIMEGVCVSHEVDVVAKKGGNCHVVECKFHNAQGKANDVKIPLYISSRFEDIQKKIDHAKDILHYQGWVVTNTRFTEDAKQYGKCAGLQMISWDYPNEKSLRDRITNSRLFPVTSLTTLTRREKSALLERGVILCKELCENQDALREIGLGRSRLRKVMADLDELCLQ